MTDAPDHLPDPPGLTRGLYMDALVDVLQAMCFTGGIFLDAEFTSPWCVISRVEPVDCQPFAPEPAHIIAYHYVTAGRLLLQVEGLPPAVVKAGEIVVLPRNDEHRVGSALNLRPVNANDLIQLSADGGLARIVYGGGGERTRILCGFLGSAVRGNPALYILPRVLRIDVEGAASGAWIESSFRFAAQELAGGRGQSTAVLAKLAELLFIEAVRRYLASLPPEQSGWLAGLRDPFVGRALALLHSRMTHRWTTEELAREAGLSRSAFAQRFTSLTGEPPMRYLARWRLQGAAQRLKESTDPVSRVAFETGYESEASFNRAFKREFGLPPAAWRKCH